MHYFFLFIVSFAFYSCSKTSSTKEEVKTECENSTFHISIESESDSSHYILIDKEKNKKAWKIPYPIYHWEIADVDEDGCDEILVGVIKTTRFDPNPGKRLFIFKLFEGHIRPKWMGSRLSQPLVQFKCIRAAEQTHILSMEKEPSDKFTLAIYQYGAFGLEFQTYLIRELNKREADLLFQFL